MDLPVRAHQEHFNGTILEFASLRLGFRLSSRAFRATCARPFSPPPFALTAAQPTPPAPLTCAACSPSTRASHAAPTQPGRYQFSAPSTRVPIGCPVTLARVAVHTFQVRAGDSRGARTPSLARSLRARRRHLNGAMYEFGCCRCAVASCCLLWSVLGTWRVDTVFCSPACRVGGTRCRSRWIVGTSFGLLLTLTLTLTSDPDH